MAEHKPCGIHSIDHLALNVPSIEEAKLFFTAFGLDVKPLPGGKELELRALDGHRSVRVLAAARKSLAYLSFNCFASDLDALTAQVKAMGGAPMLPAAHTDQRGFLCKDPDGNLIQVKVGPKTQPDFKIAGAPSGVGENRRAAHSLAQSERVRPRRLSHVLLFTTDMHRTVAFYQGALGLQVSDTCGQDLAYMHARHGCDHHLVAFASSTHRGFHHAAWDVHDINEAGLGGAQMAACGFKKGWGTGRHWMGSNYYHYVSDPWGSYWEYSADMDFIAAGRRWGACDAAQESAVCNWGPDAPDDFLKNTETAAPGLP